MADVMVTIRLPDTLLEELKNLAKEQHYVDLSELIRSVLRRKFEQAQHASPDGISDSIIRDVKRKTVMTSEARLLNFF